MNDFGDTMTYTLIVTLFGMGIVFIVLVLLQYILEGMRIVFAPKKKEAQGAALKVLEEKTVQPAAAEAAEELSAAEDSELIAVITAAVACCMGTQSNIVVKSIKRVYDQTPAWGKAGRSEQMASRF